MFFSSHSFASIGVIFHPDGQFDTTSMKNMFPYYPLGDLKAPK